MLSQVVPPVFGCPQRQRVDTELIMKLVSKRFSLVTLGSAMAAILMASAVGCSNTPDEGGTAPGVEVQHARVDGSALDALAPGKKLVLDMRADAKTLYHVYDAESLDLSRIEAQLDDGSVVPMESIVATLEARPYNPLATKQGDFVLTGNPANFEKLADDDMLRLTEGGWTMIEAGEASHYAPQTVDPCFGQAIFQKIESGASMYFVQSDAYVCPGSGSCNAHVYGGHEYLFCTNYASWPSAAASCQASGMNLVAMNDAAEESFVYTTARTYSSQKFWTGFNDREVEGSFVWNNGDAVTYTNWYWGEPNNIGNEDCGQINRFYPAYGWNDEPCSWSFFYICESQ
jgi:hypothetical protein